MRKSSVMAVGAALALAGLATGTPVMGAAPARPPILAVNRPVTVSASTAVSVTTSPATPTVGQPLTVTAQAAIGPWYQFWVQDPAGRWYMSGPYRPQASWTFTPMTAGSWTIVAYAAPNPWAWWMAQRSQPLTVTVNAAAPSAPTSSPTGTVTLSGPVSQGMLVLPVVIRQNVNGQWVTITGDAQLDTGNSYPAAIDGTALTQAGGVADGTAATGVGFGGSYATASYSQIWIAPQSNPSAPFLANASHIPGGIGALDTDLGGSASAGQPLVANIGLPVLDQGTFTVQGNHWTWTYTPASPGAGS